MIKKLLVTVILPIFIFSISFTLIAVPPTLAQSGVPFGGMEVFFLPCTCSAGTLMWHVFTPLYIGGVPMAGALAAYSTPLAFTHYYLHPGAWALGYYFPGAGAGCFIGVQPYCVPLPNLGMISPMTGSSL